MRNPSVTKSSDGVVRLGVIERWFCVAVGAGVVSACGAAVVFAWNANAQLSQLNANVAIIAKAIDDHESRIRDLERPRP